MDRGEQNVWRVPIVLSLAPLGDLGEVGKVEVDAQTGTILDDGRHRERILQHAQRLYAGATLPTKYSRRLLAGLRPYGAGGSGRYAYRSGIGPGYGQLIWAVSLVIAIQIEVDTRPPTQANLPTTPN
jgi:hypothetical protein